MYLRDKQNVSDADHDLLVDLLHSLDQEWASVCEAARKCPDPDQFGFWDRTEYLAGLGLVACQRYMGCTYPQSGASRIVALSAPPVLACGQSMAALVNAGANFWKHAEERHWSSPRPLRKDTLQAMTRAGLSVDADYVCMDVLHAITGDAPAPFASLANSLIEWRTYLIEHAKKQIHDIVAQRGSS